MEENKIEKKEITFEDLQKANETIKTTDIKGKAYSEVNQRIKAFRMVYPTGIIETEMVSNEPNEDGVHTCIFKAIVGFRENGELYKLATGTAYEKEDSTFINKTSYIENCETSAVGRALGMAGFGIDVSVASAEEVQNAIANQEEKATQEQVDYINDLVNKKEITKEEVLDYLKECKKRKVSDLSKKEAEHFISGE